MIQTLGVSRSQTRVVRRFSCARRARPRIVIEVVHLNEDEQRAYKLRHLDGLTNESAAKVFGIHPGNFSRLVRRAERKVQELKDFVRSINGDAEKFEAILKN